MIPGYQPAQNSADFLLQAHCAVIEELLDSVLCVLAEDGALFFGEDQYSKARVRLNTAALAYQIVSGSVPR